MYVLNSPILVLFLSVVSFVEVLTWTVGDPGHVVVEYYQPMEKYEPEYDARSYKYAWSYPHIQSPRNVYMERKVYDTVSRGSVYVEGLRRALQAYIDKLRSCNDLDAKESTNAPATACKNFVHANVRARRLAQLAVWATQQILKEPHGELSDPEEIKSLVRLAELLDQLAELTGYEPKPEDYLTAPPTSPAPTTEAVTFPPLLEAANFNVSDDVIASMINCLGKSNDDSRPAYERCPRAPLPPALRTLFNITESSSGVEPDASSTDTPTGMRRKRSLSMDSETTDNPTYEKMKPQSPYSLKTVVEHRLPEDPYQDISGYSKSKEGTNIVPNPEQAVLVRLALERHFSTPNVEIVRRYGSNYNPLIVNTPLAGILRTLLDV